MSGEMLKVKFTDEQGAHFDYQIPGIWLMGFMTNHKNMSVLDVIKWWHFQAQLEAQWQAQRAAS